MQATMRALRGGSWACTNTTSASRKPLWLPCVKTVLGVNTSSSTRLVAYSQEQSRAGGFVAWCLGAGIYVSACSGHLRAACPCHGCAAARLHSSHAVQAPGRAVPQPQSWAGHYTQQCPTCWCAWLSAGCQHACVKQPVLRYIAGVSLFSST